MSVKEFMEKEAKLIITMIDEFNKDPSREKYRVIVKRAIALVETGRNKLPDRTLFSDSEADYIMGLLARVDEKIEDVFAWRREDDKTYGVS